MSYSSFAYVLQLDTGNFKNFVVAGQQLENIVRAVATNEYGVNLSPWPTNKFGPLQTPRDEYYRGVSLYVNNRGVGEISIISAINNDGNIYIDFQQEQAFPYNSNEEVIESINEACIHNGICPSNAQINKPDPSMIKRSGGCYVATAVYGSYNCPQVWTLRRYRDYSLASTWYGRLFIKLYYAISPTIVKWFGKTKWFNMFWKSKLDKMVAKLNEKGYNNTPYND